MSWKQIIFLVEVEPDCEPEDVEFEVKGTVEDIMVGQYDVLFDYYELEEMEIRPLAESWDYVVDEAKKQEEEIVEFKERLRQKLEEGQDMDTMTAYETLHFARLHLEQPSHFTRVYNVTERDHSVPKTGREGWFAATVRYHF